MCVGHLRSNTQQRQKYGIVPSPMPCIAGRYLRFRNTLYFYRALIFGYFLIKQKVKNLNYFDQSFSFDDSKIEPQNKN
jgi:hypothetical protein